MEDSAVGQRIEVSDLLDRLSRPESQDGIQKKTIGTGPEAL